jgi:exopolysaccharide biosynthesis polyprenyl glycosylphosphotransferase
MTDLNHRALNAGPYYGQQELLQPARSPLYPVVKRIIDIAGASLGLILLLPLFLVIMLLIKLDDPKGPVIFRQIRIGKNGRPFYMYKFRSMVVGSEEMLPHLLDRNDLSGPMFKMKDDPRVTKVGRVLRKFSLDELPQLWNVLKNDMSLVGPRPALPREVEQYSALDRQRLLVMPGCTGLWQVSGRSGLSFEQMIELDLYYIQHQSIWLDLVLIAKTFRAVLSTRNAY